ncbi:hypothetical protein [Amycolatopsis taiwanensis]|uniref:hypothetical protein n=1 Tax=Amycolatopsis taiwanensis TaxID=342230 RepID=UPI0004BAFAFA|nr:hypothetical protein [Amycolatopsis taiwanensis]
MSDQITAYIDEAGARLADGRRLYVLAAVLSSPAEQPKLVDALAALQLDPDEPLHFRTERPGRRLLIAEAIANASLYGAILLTTSTSNTGQEAARRALLCELLPRLEHVEHAHRVVIESRSGGDRHDRRTCDRLRQSRQITAALRIDHGPKSLPLLWPADWLASAYVAAHHHDDRGPWKIISDAHVVDVTIVDPG